MIEFRISSIVLYHLNHTPILTDVFLFVYLFFVVGIEPRALHVFSEPLQLHPSHFACILFLKQRLANFAWAGLKPEILLPLPPKKLEL
jgi:hypothetical protein